MIIYLIFKVTRWVYSPSRWLWFWKGKCLKKKVKSFSHVWLTSIPWTVVYKAFLSTGFSRQEYWSGVPSFSRGSSQPRDWIWVSRIAGRRFTLWATREERAVIVRKAEKFNISEVKWRKCFQQEWLWLIYSNDAEKMNNWILDWVTWRLLVTMSRGECYTDKVLIESRKCSGKLLWNFSLLDYNSCKFR